MLAVLLNNVFLIEGLWVEAAKVRTLDLSG
jgi:hypothetical protein